MPPGRWAAIAAIIGFLGLCSNAAIAGIEEDMRRAMSCSSEVIRSNPYGAEKVGMLAMAAYSDCPDEWDAVIDTAFFSNPTLSRDALSNRIRDNAVQALIAVVVRERERATKRK